MKVLVLGRSQEVAFHLSVILKALRLVVNSIRLVESLRVSSLTPFVQIGIKKGLKMFLLTFVQDVDQLVVIKACLFSTISVCESTVDTCKGHCQGKDGWTDTSHCLMGIDKKEIKKVKTTSGNRQRYEN